MMKLIMTFLYSWRGFSRNGDLIGRKNIVAQQLTLHTSQLKWKSLDSGNKISKFSYDLVNTDFKKKGFRNITNVFNELLQKKQNQSMNFQSCKFGSLNGRKQLHITDCRVLVLEMTLEIVTEEIIFY